MRLEVPEGVRFTCSQCGDCCRQLDVLLGPGERERLSALDWTGRDDSLVGVEPVARAPSVGKTRRYRLARTADGACVFLGDRDQCRLHEHFGAAAKPSICQLYPFSFYPVGDAMGVDAAFSCRAVAMGLGEPIERRRGEWSALFEVRSQIPAMPHRLATGKQMTGAVLWEIEGHLGELLSRRDLAMPDRIRCALAYLRLATTGDPMTDSAAILRATMARSLPQQIARMAPSAEMDATQRAVFFLWLYLALNPAPASLHALPGKALQREAERRAADAERFRLNEGRPWVDNRELDLSFADVDRIDPAGAKACEDLIAIFFRAKLVGQRFLMAGDTELPLVEAALRLLLCYPMVIWTAKAMAAARRADRVDEADIRGAIRLIDRSLGHIDLSRMNAKQREAWRYMMSETQLVEAATHWVASAGEGGELVIPSGMDSS